MSRELRLVYGCCSFESPDESIDLFLACCLGDAHEQCVGEFGIETRERNAWNDFVLHQPLYSLAPVGFKFDDEFFAWRDWKIDLQRLIDRRRFVTTFGSCSFDEPREDLRSLKLF